MVTNKLLRLFDSVSWGPGVGKLVAGAQRGSGGGDFLLFIEEND